MYNCQICNYVTQYYSNLYSHNKTKKHLENLEKSTSINPYIVLVNPVNPTVNLVNPTVNPTICYKHFACVNCNFTTKHASSYSRHKKICKINKKEVEKNEDIEDIKEELEFSDDNLMDIVKELKYKVNYLEKEKDLYKKLEKEKTDMLNNFMNNANTIINKANDNTKITAQTLQTVSMSAIKYANEKFKDTPALLPLDNFNINNLSFDNEEDKKQLVEILIYNAKQKSLDKLLGDHIIKYYKKENPEEQAFHATDCSRLNYIVRELIENALTWSIDKNGLKICKDIVKPLIKKCIDILLEHQKKLLRELSIGNYSVQKDVELIIDVIMSIDSGSLENEINRYIAPYFNLKKDL